MSRITHVAWREVRMGFRNPWSYSFMGLFAIFMLSLLLINSQGYVEGYSGITGTMLNLILYLLPLMTLLLGSFSITGEKEDGSWELLSTYPVSSRALLVGKYAGLAVVLLIIVAFSFGLAGAIGGLTGSGFHYRTYLLLLVFSGCVTLLYLGIAVVVGTLARNRWQALTIGVAIWFFSVIGWQPTLIALLGILPYPWIKPSITTLTLLNPAELSRLFIVVKLGGGSILGPEYYNWVQWIRRPSGTIGFVTAVWMWIGAAGSIAYLIVERGKSRA